MSLTDVRPLRIGERDWATGDSVFHTGPGTSLARRTRLPEAFDLLLHCPVTRGSRDRFVVVR